MQTVAAVDAVYKTWCVLQLIVKAALHERMALVNA